MGFYFRRHFIEGVAAASILTDLVWRQLLVFNRFIDADELEHSHSAWCIAHGLLPYRDYYENHTPAFHFLLAPVIALFHSAETLEHARAFFDFSRELSLLGSCFALFLTYSVASKLFNRRTGWLAAAFLSGTLFFNSKGIEIRPDIPAMCLWLASLSALLDALQSEKQIERRTISLSLALSGFLLGLSVLFTQKALFPGLGLAGGILFFRPRWSGAIARMSIWAGSALIPMVGALFYFKSQGALGNFIKYAWIQNTQYQDHLSYFTLPLELLRHDPLIVVLGAWGAIHSIYSGHKRHQLTSLLGFSVLGFTLGLIMISYPWSQYYLFLLPMLSVFAADSVMILSRESIRLLKSRLAIRLDYRIPVTGIILFLALREIQSWPARTLESNQKDWEGIRLVMESTTLKDTVLDGWSGYGAFRKHAFFYTHLFMDMKDLENPTDRARLVARLTQGQVTPKIVILNDYLANFSSDFTRYLSQNYQSIGQKNIWIRNSP